MKKPSCLKIRVSTNESLPLAYPRHSCLQSRTLVFVNLFLRLEYKGSVVIRPRVCQFWLSIFLQVVGTITFQCRSSILEAPQPVCSNTHIIGIVEVELEGAYTHNSLSGCGLGRPSTTTMLFLRWHTGCSYSEDWIWPQNIVLHPCSADKQLMDSSVKFVQD